MMTFQELREQGPVHTDRLLRAHQVLLSIDPHGARLVDWKTHEPVNERRAVAYLDELEAESPMGFPGEEVAAMLRSMKVEGPSDGSEQR